MDADQRIVNNYVTDHLPINNNGTQLTKNAPIPVNRDNERANRALSNAATAAVMAAPITTAMGVAMMFNSGHDSWGINHVIRMLGVPVAIGGLVVDTAKLPFVGGYSIGSLFWGLILKTKSLFTRPDRDEQQTREIMESFAHRFANTMQLLVALKLETPETIVDKFNKYQKGENSQGLGALCALTTLNTAYASRGLSQPSILLANGKVLHQEHCPQKGLDIFNSVVDVRNLLRQLGLHRKSNREATPIVLQWVPIIKQALEDDNYQIEIDVPIDTQEILMKIIVLLKKISRRATSQKQLKNTVESLHEQSLVSVQLVPQRVIISTVDRESPRQIPQESPQQIPRESPQQIPRESPQQIPSSLTFIDPETQETIVDAVIGNNGRLYNHSTAQTLIQTRRISHFVKFYSAGGPSNPRRDSEELSIDPITCNEIEHPVVGNDGRIYDRETALNLQHAGLVGVGGIVVTSYIECPNLSQW